MKLGLIHLRTENISKGHHLVPNGVGYLSSYVEKYCGVEDSYIEIYMDKLMEKNPDVIGISSVSEAYPLARSYAREIKSLYPKIKIIIGGPHITAIPKSLDPAFDVGVMSEGEEQFGEIITLIQKNELIPDKLKNIAGVVFRDENNELIATDKKEWIKDLDLIPPPNRKALANISMRSGNVRLNQYLMTERGCPFKCEYCATTSFWETVRTHSLERVMLEIEEIIRDYPYQTFIDISDDLFGMNKKRLRKMVEMIKAEGYHKKAKFVCQTRASCFSEEIAQLFAEMNLKIACFGFESSNDRVLKFLKGNGSAKLNQKSIDLCDKYGVNVLGNFIAGSPTETETEMADTYWFMRRNLHKTFQSNLGVATPFPNTKWWEYAKNMKVLDDSFDNWEILHLGFEPNKTIYMNEVVDSDKFSHIIDRFYDITRNKSLNSHEDVNMKMLYEDFNKKQLESLADQINAKSKNQKEKLNVLEISNLIPSLEKMMENANYTRISVIDGVEEKIPENINFDYIIIPYSLETALKPKLLLSKLKYLLSPNGLMIINIYNTACITFFNNLLNNVFEQKSFGIYNYKNINFFTLRKLYFLLTKLGYKNITSERIYVDSEDTEKELNKFSELFSGFTNNSIEYSKELKTASFFVTCTI